MQVKTEDGRFAAAKRNTCEWDAAAKSTLLTRMQLYPLSSIFPTGLKGHRDWV